MILSLGHILQRLRSGRFLQQFVHEWDAFREKGRIKDDYMQTEQHQECLQEMLDFLDRDATPDETRFSILKKILLTAATETNSDRDSVLPQQYMKICRGLSSGEVIVLLATYRVANREPPVTEPSGLRGWLTVIAGESNLKHPELVAVQEQGLMEKQLLTGRSYKDRSGVTLGQGYRLTGLGLAICHFVEAYDQLADAKAAAGR